MFNFRTMNGIIFDRHISILAIKSSISFCLSYQPYSKSKSICAKRKQNNQLFGWPCHLKMLEIKKKKKGEVELLIKCDYVSFSTFDKTTTYFSKVIPFFIVAKG